MSLERVGALNVLTVRGSFYEMGHQHGQLLREQVHEGPVPYFRSYVERLVGRSLLGPLSPLAWPLVKHLIGRKVAMRMPEFALETMRGLAEGAGMPPEVVLEAATMPDALLVVVSGLIRAKRIGPAVEHRVALGMGCTSAIAWGPATSDGLLLHARNFDYHGVGHWPKTATVLFQEPERGQRYVSIAAAGVPMGGATAMNEAGLTLAVHQHMFTDQARLGGLPIGVAGDRVMREAETLDEAEAMLREDRPIGSWTYVISDGRRGEVLCLEQNPRRCVALRTQPGDRTLGYANIFLDPELGATERNLYGSYWRHNRARYERVNELLQLGDGSLDPAAMAAMLADIGTTPCRLHSAIAILMTVGSVVFRPADGVFWMAAGESPTSRRPFLPFSLARGGPAPEHGELAVDTDPEEAKAFEAYRRAYLACIDDEDVSAALAHMERACGAQPRQPLYHHLRGLLHLRAGQGSSAAQAFSRALELGHPDAERLATFHLWRGRARDLGRDRLGAVEDYRAALSGPGDPPVHAAAGRGLRRQWPSRKARTVNLDFAYGDVVVP